MRVTVDDNTNDQPQDLLAQILRQQAGGGGNPFNPAAVMNNPPATPPPTNAPPPEREPAMPDPLDDPFVQAGLTRGGITPSDPGTTSLLKSGSGSKDKAAAQAYQPGYVGSFFNDVNQMARTYLATQNAAARAYAAGFSPQETGTILGKMNEAVGNTQNMSDADFYNFMEDVADAAAEEVALAQAAALEAAAAARVGTPNSGGGGSSSGGGGSSSGSGAGAAPAAPAPPPALPPAQQVLFNNLHAKFLAGKISAAEYEVYLKLLKAQGLPVGGGPEFDKKLKELAG